VPVEQGETLDIGILDIGGGVAGCGPAEEVTAPVLPTFTPTALPTIAPPTPTPAPTATPVPVVPQEAVPADQPTEPAPQEEMPPSGG
jgi:hypothetical protein